VLPKPQVIDNRFVNVEHFESDYSTEQHIVDMQDKSAWRIKDKILISEPPCPEGYSLSESDGVCYQTCPKGYRDDRLACTQEGHRIERPSYDRGNGIPYAESNTKHRYIQLPSGCRT
jgi:hypothetical protein